MRIVVDTNVLISAALFDASVPGQAVYKALQLADLLLSLETLNELHDVLRRSQFDKYLTVEEREEFLSALTMRARIVEVSVRIDDCRDPKDNKLLELAVDGKASCIISGDDDLLELHSCFAVDILTPADFLTRYS